MFALRSLKLAGAAILAVGAALPALAAADDAVLPPAVASALAKTRAELHDTSDLPAPVVDMLSKARDDCPAGFKDDGAVQQTSLTGDGKPSYIMDPHKLACAGSPHLFSGDGPSSIELFVTLPSGQVVHTGGVVALAYTIQPGPDGGAPIIAFETHADGERAGTISFYRWDGQNFNMLRRQSMDIPPE
jgi:hypothetical protein